MIIVNPISGGISKYNVLGIIASHINMQKYEVTMRSTLYAGHATELSANAVKEGFDMVVVVGGDGTVNEVARSLVNTPIALGIIPCGSGNGLARHLRIPMNVRKAVEIINEGIIDTIDSMTVNGIPCFCTAGVGYDAQVSAEYAKDSRRGLLTYVRKAIAGWFKYKPQEYIIETDNLIHKIKAVSVTLANANQWGNEFHIAPKASLKDGLIDVTIINPIKFKNAIKFPFQILSYSVDRNPDICCFKTGAIIIRRPYNDFIHVDGEPVSTDKNIHITINPQSLKLIVNPLVKP